MRRVIWPMRLFSAISLGVPVRIIRRLLRRPPCIWQAFIPLHSLTASVKADRLAGFPSQSVIKQPYEIRTYTLTTGADFDVVIAFDGGETYDQHWKCLCHLLQHGDIWVTMHEPFFPVFRLLRLAGIRIVVFPYGDDVALRDRCRDRYDWAGRMQEDYKDWSLTE
jgi:hypothetical protein